MAIGEVGRLVGGRYRIDRELERGPGTLSQLVTDLRSGRPCVLRELSVAAASPAAARRFEAQAAILAKLDHPGLPRFVDAFSEGEGDALRRMVVTSYHPGESLERLVGKGRPLTEAQALLLLRRIVPVLVYLHSFDPPLVHRTISATGIILGPDGRPCLTDLDYAGAEVAAPTSAQAPPGPDELALAAPEVFMDGAVPASDIYAVGLAICRAMTARDPASFLREGARVQLRGALGVSEAFAAVVARMLEPSLERRYPDAKALEADLARFAGVRVALAQSGPAQPPKARAPEEPRPRRVVRPLVIAGCLLAVVAALAFVAYRLRNPPAPGDASLIPPTTQDAAVPAPPPTAAAPPATPAETTATVLAPEPRPAAESPAPAVPPASAVAPEAAPAAAPSAAPAIPAPPPPPAAVVPAPPPPTPPLPAAAATPASVEGKLLFDGKPFTGAAAPNFWFRKQGTSGEAKAQVEYAAGAFTVRGLGPGRYAMSVRIDNEPKNPKTFPGDLTAWEEFAVESARPVVLDVSLRTIMHLVQPVDNGVVIPGWDVPCGAGNVHPGKVLFSWEALGPDTRYDVSVDRLACGRGAEVVGRELARSTTESWVRLDLPPNREGECYVFKLTANRGGKTIGIMNTHGKTGIGWDYRFTVAGR